MSLSQWLGAGSESITPNDLPEENDPQNWPTHASGLILPSMLCEYYVYAILAMSQKHYDFTALQCQNMLTWL